MGQTTTMSLNAGNVVRMKMSLATTTSWMTIGELRVSKSSELTTSLTTTTTSWMTIGESKVSKSSGLSTIVPRVREWMRVMAKTGYSMQLTCRLTAC